jgi:carbamoyltransferase
LIKEKLIDIKEDGSFSLDMNYFGYATSLLMTNKKFHDLFGAPPRKPETQLTQREMDIAASIQSVTEEVVLKLAKGIAKETGLKNLCLAGGVALNCVANGKLLREGIFENIWIQPAAGDAGGSIGAALAVYHMKLNQSRVKESKTDKMRGTYLGPEFNQNEIELSLKKQGAVFESLNEIDLNEKTAQALSNGYAVGWHQGRMEFGPRSLGGRSIIADPRSSNMQKILNLKVKDRESFRPFAPSILREDLEEWFDFNCDSPYMLMVGNVKDNKRIKITSEQENLFGIDKLNVPRSLIPAVTHIDYSARIQTVHSDTNPKYYNLIKRFKEITGCPILVNTSFNVRGEPIVLTPEDAYKCFMGTGLDFLVIGNCFLSKKMQNVDLLKTYERNYELD